MKKSEIIALLRDEPENLDVDKFIYTLWFRRKIERALNDVDRDEGIPHDLLPRSDGAASRREADEMIKRIHAAVGKLADAPESGRAVPEFPEGILRELLVESYRVVYRYLPEQDLVQILAVLHTSKLVPETD